MLKAKSTEQTGFGAPTYKSEYDFSKTKNERSTTRIYDRSMAVMGHPGDTSTNAKAIEFVSAFRTKMQNAIAEGFTVVAKLTLNSPHKNAVIINVAQVDQVLAELNKIAQDVPVRDRPAV